LDNITTEFLYFTGAYELFGFGRIERGVLKMESMADELQGDLSTPIWKKRDVDFDSQYFIIKTNTHWELHEMNPSYSKKHLYLKIPKGLIRHLSYFKTIFRL